MIFAHTAAIPVGVMLTEFCKTAGDVLMQSIWKLLDFVTRK